MTAYDIKGGKQVLEGLPRKGPDDQLLFDPAENHRIWQSRSARTQA